MIVRSRWATAATPQNPAYTGLVPYRSFAVGTPFVSMEELNLKPLHAGAQGDDL